MKMTAGALMVCILFLGPASGQAAGDIDAVRERVMRWRDAWQQKNIGQYAAQYHPAFRSGQQDYRRWIEKKRELFRKTAHFSVDLFGLTVVKERGHATARFIQRYRGPTYTDVGEKTLILEKADGQWLIISEQWEPFADDVIPPVEKPAPAPVSQAPVPPAPAPQAPNAAGVETLFGPDSHGGIACVAGDAGVEKVYVRLKDFFIPRIFNINGQKPRIVIDINNVSRWPGRRSVPVHGRLIRQVRSHLHGREKRLRIVLDLEPSKNYQVSQTYYKAENVYCVEVSDGVNAGAKNPNSLPGPDRRGDGAGGH